MSWILTIIALSGSLIQEIAPGNISGVFSALTALLNSAARMLNNKKFSSISTTGEGMVKSALTEEYEAATIKTSQSA
jgi:hypothetical protein